MTEKTTKRRAKGVDPRYRHLRRYQWKPGQSGNPKGRPKGSSNRVGHGMAMDKLIKLVDSKRAPAAVQLRAARIFLEIVIRSAGLWDPAPSRWR